MRILIQKNLLHEYSTPYTNDFPLSQLQHDIVWAKKNTAINMRLKKDIISDLHREQLKYSYGSSAAGLNCLKASPLTNELASEKFNNKSQK